MAIFCIAIKGNDRRCCNYAWKKCDEQLCWQHRNLSEKNKKIEEIDPDICYIIDCKSRVYTHILLNNIKKYSCWKHSLKG